MRAEENGVGLPVLPSATKIGEHEADGKKTTTADLVVHALALKRIAIFLKLGLPGKNFSEAPHIQGLLDCNKH